MRCNQASERPQRAPETSRDGDQRTTDLSVMMRGVMKINSSVLSETLVVLLKKKPR